MRRELANSLTKHLVIRNGIYYYRIDKRQPNGKYKAFRKSLGTADLSEALRQVQLLEGRINQLFLPDANYDNFIGKVCPNGYVMPTIEKQTAVDKFLPKHSISELLEKMLFVGGNVEEYKRVKRSALKKMVQGVGLSMDDDYMQMNNRSVIDAIVANICARTEVQNNNKRYWLCYLKEFVLFAHKFNGDVYKDTILAGLPNIKKTPKCQRRPHMPFSSGQLDNIFNPRHKFFNTHPEEFIACLIGLFSCSRTSAAVTLMYGDWVDADIPYIYFRPNHDKKKLKTEASERKLPIAKQLLDFGLLDLIKKKQQMTMASDTDFIFSRSSILTGDPAKKFFSKYFRFLESIGIKNSVGEKYDFHSFRNTTSNRLKEIGVEITRINAIGGWTGKGAVEESYSKHRLDELKHEVDKLYYEELHLDYWKPIITEAFLKVPK